MKILFLFQTIRTTVWTKHDDTIRTDEIKEEHELEENDDEDQRHRVDSVLQTQYGGMEMAEKEKPLQADGIIKFFNLLLCVPDQKFLQKIFSRN